MKKTAPVRRGKSSELQNSEYYDMSSIRNIVRILPLINQSDKFNKNARLILIFAHFRNKKHIFAKNQFQKIFFIEISISN